MSTDVPDAGASVGAAAGLPRILGPEVLAGMVSASLDGIAILTEERRYLYVNPAGCRILGRSATDLIGRPAAFGPADAPGNGRDHAGDIDSTTVQRPDGCVRELEYRRGDFAAGARRLTALTFRDVTEARQQQRRLSAFGRAAHRVAYAGSLRRTLNDVAAEVVRTTDVAACQIVIIDPVGARPQVFGAAGPNTVPDDFGMRYEHVRRNGGELLILEAFRTRRPQIRWHRKAEMLADAAWQPLHAFLDSFGWDDFVAVPLFVRDEPSGTLNVFCRPGRSPGPTDISFLNAMADQAAIAVDNARLSAESRRRGELEERQRIARDLHDSISQDLFSMTLHSKAALLALGRSGADLDDSVRHSVTALAELAKAALVDMRAVIFELYPTALHDHGLVETLRHLASSLAVREGLQVDIDAPTDRLSLDPELEENAYRLVLEAVHNVVKHANVGIARVHVGVDPADDRTLVIKITDNGAGFDPGAVRPGRLGLTSMRQRAEALGGQLHVISKPGRGTTVRVVVPGALRRCAARSDDLATGTGRPAAGRQP